MDKILRDYRKKKLLYRQKMSVQAKERNGRFPSIIMRMQMFRKPQR